MSAGDYSEVALRTAEKEGRLGMAGQEITPPDRIPLGSLFSAVILGLEDKNELV
jgi:hypothetical protein